MSARNVVYIKQRGEPSIPVTARQVNPNDDENPILGISDRRIGALYFEINKWFISLKEP